MLDTTVERGYHDFKITYMVTYVIYQLPPSKVAFRIPVPKFCAEVYPVSSELWKNCLVGCLVDSHFLKMLEDQVLSGDLSMLVCLVSSAIVHNTC